ncbi:glycosyltransferase family 9 protein [Psychroserpens sp.]|uniref:glycosyltransferase family 9 protein n=1 Tax=Psychroserpens sp. TaxID=2020870 RepID=UPI00385C8D50
MSFLTENVGSSHVSSISILDTDIEINKILIVRPNHRLGNMILTTPLIQEVIDTFPNCEIDLLAKGNIAPIIFNNYTNIKDYILLPRKPFNELIKYCLVWFKVKNRKYDLVINAVKGSSSGKLLTKISNSRYKVFGEIDDKVIDKNSDSYHMAKNPIYNLRSYFSVLGLHKNERKIASLDIKLAKDEMVEGGSILKDIFKNDKKTISIFTYATGSKCYSKSWWCEFYTQLKINNPDYNILEILPAEYVSQIDFEAETFYSNDIREVASVIANTDLFIGADSGIMHLASSTKTTVVGLFSKTRKEKYKPYGNGSLAIDTNANNANQIKQIIKEVLGKRMCLMS